MNFGRLLVIAFALVLVTGSASVTATNDHAAISHNGLLVPAAAADFNVTWTSRSQTEPQFLMNSSSLIGDHVVLNTTYLGTAGLTPPFVTNISILGGANPVYVGAEGVTLSFDTYVNCSNGIYTLHVNTTDSLDQQASCVFENIFIGNYFAPDVDNVQYEEVLPDYYNITWTCNDQNADDINFYSVWISSDDGVSFQRIGQNLTVTFFEWNATGFLDDYIVRIRAYSVDLNLYPGPFVSIPGDYVPGDYADAFSPTFTPSGPWTTYDVGVVPPTDITLAIEETTQLTWNLTFTNGNWLPGYVEYSITVTSDTSELYVHNDIITFDEMENQRISFTTIPHDEVGNYNYTLSFSNPGSSGGVVSDTVTIIVEAPLPSPILGPIVVSIALIWGLVGILAIVIIIKNRQ